MTAPFGATPYVPVFTGDLEPLAKSFGGLYELLDALNAHEAEADELERRTGARRALRADVSESTGVQSVILRESGRLLGPVAPLRAPGEGVRATEEALTRAGLL